jgi:hypothetical protein
VNKADERQGVLNKNLRKKPGFHAGFCAYLIVVENYTLNTT